MLLLSSLLAVGNVLLGTREMNRKKQEEKPLNLLLCHRSIVVTFAQKSLIWNVKRAGVLVGNGMLLRL